MSFILDALRRADAQRARGDAPRGIHAPRPLDFQDEEVDGRRWRRPAMAVACGLAVLAVAGGLAWSWRAVPAEGPVAQAPDGAVQASGAEAAASAVTAPTEPSAPAAIVADTIQPPPRLAMLRTAGPPSLATSRRPPASAQAQPDGDTSATASPPSVAGAATAAAPAAAQRNAPPPGAAGQVPTLPAMPAPPPAMPVPPSVATVPGTSTPVAPTAPGAPATQAAAPARSALPAGAPKVVVSGGVYSRDAAHRMVIVNGQVFGEGSEPVAGVRVEEIQPNRAVLRYQGQRYTVSY